MYPRVCKYDGVAVEFIDQWFTSFCVWYTTRVNTLLACVFARFVEKALFLSDVRAYVDPNADIFL